MPRRVKHKKKRKQKKVKRKRRMSRKRRRKKRKTVKRKKSHNPRNPNLQHLLKLVAREQSRRRSCQPNKLIVQRYLNYAIILLGPLC